MARLPSRLFSGRAVRRFGAAAAHLLWPWRCPLCGVTAITSGGRQLCLACEQAIHVERLRAYCPGCGDVRDAAATAGNLCPACQSRPKAFAAMAVVGSHKGALRQVIVQWKFGRCPGLGGMLGDLVADAISQQSWAGGVEGLVPIPQPWSRWLSRQSFPVGELASQVSSRLEVPVWPVLKARRHRRQVGLGMEERLRNVREVFSVRGNVDLTGRRLCLIDDVATTGATLVSAARALRSSGAAEVYVATIAKAG